MVDPAAAAAINTAAVGATDGLRRRARVFLRIKRRRSPVPSLPQKLQTAAGDDATSANNGMGVGSKRKGKYIAPERIKLALPTLNDSVAAATGANKRSKRRRMSPSMFDNKEGSAFLQRLSSVNLVHCEKEMGNDGERTNDARMPVFTPSRLQRGSNVDEGGDDEQRTPPSFSFDSDTRTITKGTIQKEAIPRQSNGDATPAESQAPVKPKRNVIFRKITDLRKCLDNQQQQQHMQQPGESPSQSTMQVVHGGNNDGDWSSKRDEREKWLRVVDVRLEADDEDVSSCSDNSGDYCGGGVGPRVRRMRTRPSDTDDDENLHNRRTRKRRKLGVAVEQSQTVKASEFLGNMNADKFDTNDCVLDPEVLRLIDYSLASLHNQNGGSVSPHLSFLRIDPRLRFVAGTPRGKLMVNRQYHGTGNGLADGRGRTVLHIAALWGDVAGIRAAIDMGADTTILDGQGLTPAALAKLYGQEDVASAFIVENNSEPDTKEKSSEGTDEGDYYYELYCLEEGDDETDKENNTEEEKKDDREDSHDPLDESQHSSSICSTNSHPGLARAKNWDEDDDEYNFELRQGYGAWNENGELILEADVGMKSQEKDSMFVQRLYHSQGIEDDESMIEDGEHDSNDERYDGNDYPDDDDDQSFGLGSNYDDYQDADAHYYGVNNCSDDDDSDDGGWKLDFRKRNVGRSVLNLEGDSDDEDYAGPMFGEEVREEKDGFFAYDPELDGDE